jgi:hypothetical protein
MATTADGTGNLGPGTLTIGMTGTPIDVSCLVNDARIDPNITAGDVKKMLCGTQKSAPDEIEWALSGNADVDAGNAAGLFALCNDHWGEVVDFVFTPVDRGGHDRHRAAEAAPAVLRGRRAGRLPQF